MAHKIQKWGHSDLNFGMPCSIHLSCLQVWYGTPRTNGLSLCHPDNGRTDGWTDGRQKLGYVMSFADWQKTVFRRVDTIINKVFPLVATNVTNGWWQFTEVQTLAQWTFGVTQWTFGVNVKNVCWKLRSVEHKPEKWKGPSYGQKLNCIVSSMHKNKRLMGLDTLLIWWPCIKGLVIRHLWWKQGALTSNYYWLKSRCL